jgi:hypothetical protein
MQNRSYSWLQPLSVKAAVSLRCSLQVSTNYQLLTLASFKQTSDVFFELAYLGFANLSAER